MKSLKCDNYKCDNHRRGLLAAIHILEPKIFANVQERRIWMQAEIGKSSCRNCDNAELTNVLKGMQSISNKERKKWGTTGPTGAQMAYLFKLTTIEMGWAGIHDVRFKNFMMRTLKLSDVRFANIGTLSRENVTAVITGLEKWISNGVKRSRVEGN